MRDFQIAHPRPPPTLRYATAQLTPLALMHQLLSNNFQFLTNLQIGKCEKERIKHLTAVQDTIGSYLKIPHARKIPHPRLYSGGN